MKLLVIRKGYVFAAPEVIYLCRRFVGLVDPQEEFTVQKKNRRLTRNFAEEEGGGGEVGGGR